MSIPTYLMSTRRIGVPADEMTTRAISGAVLTGPPTASTTRTIEPSGIGATVPASPDLPALIDPAGFNAIRGVGGSVPVMNRPGNCDPAPRRPALPARGPAVPRHLPDRSPALCRLPPRSGLLVAGFAQINWAIFPGITQGVVTFDDLLKAMFAIIILLGIGGQSREDVRHLRRANARLRGLRKVDVERVTLEASARLAREVHDGLTQELWLAKLAQARLAEMPDLPEDAKIVATTVREHADATVVRVNAVWGRSTFEVSVADNGRGFDPSSVDASTFGIVGMRERAELIGAEVEIASRPDDGTTVVLRMPGRAAS
jgi:Histidine kinase